MHEWLEGEEGDVGRHQREWARDEERMPRGKEEMEAEAKWLREEMERDAESGGGSGRL